MAVKLGATAWRRDAERKKVKATRRRRDGETEGGWAMA
jgi:hypothetical protein